MKYVIRHTIKFRIEDGTIGGLASSETVIIKRDATKDYWEQLKNRAGALNQHYEKAIGKNTFYTQRAVLTTNHIVRQCFELVDVSALQKRYLSQKKADRSRQ